VLDYVKNVLKKRPLNKPIGAMKVEFQYEIESPWPNMPEKRAGVCWLKSVLLRLKIFLSTSGSSTSNCRILRATVRLSLRATVDAMEWTRGCD
jgi:hypothetical protein